MTRKYLKLPPTKQEEYNKLDSMIEEYDKNPTEQLEQRIERQQKKIENFDREYTPTNSSDIENARNYPIQKLLDTNENIVSCINPDHDDKNPSMDIRNNYCYCYSCGATYDAIEVHKILNNSSFMEAVNFLKNG